MKPFGALGFGLFVLAILVGGAVSTKADAQPPIPPPDLGIDTLIQTPAPAPKPDASPAPQRNAQQNPQFPPVYNLPPPKKQEPKVSGPFRSCGSGAGLGLAGIALWGMLWIGNRFTNRTSRSVKK